MIDIVAYLALVGSLVALAAHGTAEVLRLSGRPTRWAWAGGMALLIALATWAPFRPAPAPLVVPQAVDGSGAGIVAPTMDRDLTDRGIVDGALASIAGLRHAIAGVPARVIGPLRSRLPAAVADALLPAWLVASAVLVALLAMTYARFGRASRRLPTAELHGARVRVSPTAGPAVVGVRQPEIVVPAWLLEASPEEQRLAVAHERAHLAARDPLLLIAGCIVAALLPWHPVSWWMLSRLRLAVEVDCDRRVLARGIARRTYGAALIDIAGRCARLPLGVPALADHATQLQQRLIAMTPTPVSFRRTRTLVLGAAALLTLAAACEARLPTSPEVERMDVAAVEAHGLARVAFGADSGVTYFIDGREASAAEAHAVAAAHIESIEVRKHAHAASSIHLTTKDSLVAAVTDADRVAHETRMAASPRLYARVRALADSVGADSTSVRRGASGRVRTRAVHATGPVTVTDAGAFQGLVFIDGVKADGKGLARLTPTQIESIEVVKGAAALRVYTEPAAANGVIRVTTKALMPLPATTLPATTLPATTVPATTLLATTVPATTSAPAASEPRE